MESFYLTLLLLFVSSIALSFFFLLNKQRASPRRLPPGKTGYPLIGETIEFLSRGWKGEPEKFIFDRMTKYASNTFKTCLFGQKMAVLCGSEGNKFLFSNENKLVVAWWPDSVNKVFPSTTQTNLKEESLKMRHMLPSFMKPESLKNYIPIMDKIAQAHFQSGWEGKEDVIVYPLAKEYTFGVACKLFVSIDDEEQVSKLAKPFDLIVSAILSVPIDLPGTPFRRGINGANFIRKKLIEIIKERKRKASTTTDDEKQDILSHMLLACDVNGQHMNENDIADKILGLLIGGHDTASAACTFLVKFLAELPHIYDQVYQEQMEIANSKPSGELLNWEDIQKMKYSWSVACEVMRLTPPVQGSFREAIEDFTYNGFYIPKGWKLYWSAHSTHRNPDYFPDPTKFDPNRFTGKGPAPYAYVPFGGGPRMCPGKEYARLEILVFIHNLVKRFKFEKMIPNEKNIVNPLPVPEKGLPVRLYPHTKHALY